MSHQIILGVRQPHGPMLVAADSDVIGEVRWTPPHELTPVKERRRIERAQVKLDEAAAILTAPVDTPDE